MKKLQAMVYVLILFCIVTALVQGNKYEQDALFCADYYDANFDSYNKYLYWKDDGLCCKFIIGDVTNFDEKRVIIEYCENRNDG